MSTRIKKQSFVLYDKNGFIENAMALQLGNMKHLLMKMIVFLGNVFFVILKIWHPDFHLGTSLTSNFMICMVWIFLHNYNCCLHMNYDQSFLIFQLLIILIWMKIMSSQLVLNILIYQISQSRISNLVSSFLYFM